MSFKPFFGRVSLERDKLKAPEQQRFNAALLRLLKSPPQPRTKRERGERKPTRTRASRASARKP